MRWKLLVFDNKVGIVTDANLIKKLIHENITENVSITFIDTLQSNDVSDVGIWIQNFDINHLEKFKTNIFFINEEWAGEPELKNLHRFDYVVCKSKYAQNLLKPYCDAVCLPFISLNYYDNNVVKSNKTLHFMGRAIQKNTELVLQQTVPVTLIDSYNRYRPNSNFTHINKYQTKDELIYLLNSHNTHLCISLYESWGHYLFEGLSTGAEIICSDIPVFREQLDPELVHFIPTVDKIDLKYVYDHDNIDKKFPLRKGFYVDPTEFKNKLTTFDPIGKERERRMMYNDLMSDNQKALNEFFLQFVLKTHRIKP